MQTAITQRAFMRGDGHLRICVAVTDRAWAAAWICCQSHTLIMCILGIPRDLPGVT
jgi:hypothetical protein